METKGISKLDLKRRNRKQILLAIRQSGMLARVDIANQLALTRAAVTIITNQMIQQGILEDMCGSAPSPEPDEPKKKGRRKTMIRINPDYRYVLGAAITEHHISVGLANLANEAGDKAYMEITADTEQEEIISFLVKTCEKLLKKNTLNSKQVLGLGVAIAPERWKQMRGVVQEDGSVSFDKLGYLLEMELSIPACCGNSVELFGLANVNHTTIGNGGELILCSGEVYHSAVTTEATLLDLGRNTAAIDSYIVQPGGASAEGYPDGSVHAELSRAAVLGKIRNACGGDRTVEQINEAYAANDGQVCGVVNDVLDKLATLIYNNSITQNAPRVILQNFMFSDQILEVLQSKVSALSDRIAVERSTIAGDNAFLAGASLAVERYFYETGGIQANEASPK